MSKNPLHFIFFILMFGQAFKAQTFVSALEAKGILQDKAELKKIPHKDQDILFLPMHHLGTRPFYQDVQNKVDSLAQQGYFFYLEMISAKADGTDDLMKLRKIFGMGLPTNGYQKALELITTKIKSLRGKLILQPPYADWNLNDQNSQNVDATLAGVIKRYEAENGEIILENCDLKVPDITQNTRCRYNKKLKQAYNTLLLEYRNKIIAEKVLSEKRQKLVLIYGEGHYPGIKKLLENSSQF